MTETAIEAATVETMAQEAESSEVERFRSESGVKQENPATAAKGGLAKRPKALGAAYGIRSELVAELCKVDVATARRWKSGVTRMPYTAAVLVSGDLGAFSAHWQGWRIQGDAIISPDGWQIRRDDALTVPLMLGQINALRAEIAKYREWDDKDEQPAPPDVLPAIIG